MSIGIDTAGNMRGLSLFAEFTDDELQAFQELAERVSVKPGEKIVRQDETGDCMFILLTGQASVIHTKEGKNFQLATLQAGDFFGELALVDEGPRSADVEALEESTLLRISQGVVSALAGVYPNAAFKFLIAVGRVLVSRLRKGNQKYIDSLLTSKN